MKKQDIQRMRKYIYIYIPMNNTSHFDSYCQHFTLMAMSELFGILSNSFLLDNVELKKVLSFHYSWYIISRE